MAWVVAWRPKFPVSVMTREELNQLKHSLLMLSPHTVQDNYQKTLEMENCRLREVALAPAVDDAGTQELVTPWRVWWRWRRLKASGGTQALAGPGRGDF